MEIQRFTFNPFQTNMYVCHEAGEAVVVDASCLSDGDIASVESYVRDHGLTVKHLLLTHAHIDHIFGCARLAAAFGQDYRMHREEKELLENAEQQARLFGVKIEPPPPVRSFVAEGDTVTCGQTELKVLHTPGHSPGSICLLDERTPAVISGDVLFKGSIGRTDLWRGSLPELMNSIFQRILPLGDEVRLYPGHGPETTIGDERRTNPFLTRGGGPHG